MMSDSEDADQVEIELPSLTELERWPNKDLQTWLWKRGLPKSGVKHVLAKRVFRTMRNGESDITDTDTDSDHEEIQSAEVLHSDEWVPATVDNLPDITYNDVENYFLFRKSNYGKKRNCKRQLIKAKRFSSERYVGQIEVNVRGEVLFIRASCRPSMRTTVTFANGKKASFYSLTITLVQSTGKVYDASCNCKAGIAGLCSHVGGTLLTLIKINDTCTSSSCTWNKPNALAKSHIPQRVCDIRIYKPEKQCTPTQKPYPGVFEPSPCGNPAECSTSFLEDLLAGLETARPTCRLYRTLNSKESDISNILHIYKPPFSYHDRVDISTCQLQFESFANNLELTDSDSEKVEHGTRGQANNMNWKEARTHILTASNFGSLIKRRPQTPSDGILRTLRGYRKCPNNVPSLNYGRRMETRALLQYQAQHSATCHATVFVENRGLKVNPRFPFLGASVDGYVKCEKCGEGLVEVKCPYGKKNIRWRNLDIEACCQSKDFCCQWIENTISLKKNHNYYYQVQGQLAVYNLQWADLFVWTKKGSGTQRLVFDQNCWNDMYDKLRKFYVHDLVAEMFTTRVARNVPLYP